VTDKRFRDAIEVDDRFQSEVMIALERFHRLFPRFELCSHNQLAILDLIALLRGTPSFSVEFMIEIVRVDERSSLEQLRLESRWIGGMCGTT
jgi:hypothetical protein